MNTNQNTVNPATGKHMKRLGLVVATAADEIQESKGFPRGNTTPDDMILYFPGSVEDRIARELQVKMAYLASINPATRN